MNPFSSLGRLLAGLGRLLVRALRVAQARGLDDAILDHAQSLVREAGLRFLDNAQRREWAVKQLIADLRGIPESVARFAVEAAVQLVKAEIAGRQ